MWFQGKCDCCSQEAKVAVACIPGMPMSIAWCQKCIDADVVPYWVCVSQTACINGLERAAKWWEDLVRRSLVYHKKSWSDFTADVQQGIKDLNNYDPQEATVQGSDEPTTLQAQGLDPQETTHTPEAVEVPTSTDRCEG